MNQDSINVITGTDVDCRRWCHWFLSVRPELGAQVPTDLRLQAQLWTPPLPGDLSPWKL